MDAGEQPTLSICLVTYNRAKFLESLLPRIFSEGMAGLSFEVVLCDNCSTDETQAIATSWSGKRSEIRYFRQNRNVGALNNQLTSYRLARGKYAIYLADDDLLIPEAVAETVRYLEENPEVVVAHAPWELWDDVDKKTLGLFYHLPESRTFNRSQSLELVNYVLEKYVFPEICIYRTEVLHQMHLAPSAGFWAFVYLAVCLNFGQVAFLKRPFYRSITRHSIGLERQQEGHVQVISELDSYRTGIEVLISAAFRFQGLSGVPATKIEIVQQMIRRFISERVSVAIRLLKANRNFIAAGQYLTRLQVAGFLNDAQVAEERKLLTGPMVGQAVTELYGGISILTEIVLSDVEQAQATVDLLRKFKPELSLRIESVASLCSGNRVANALIVTSYAAQRKRLVDAGYPSGLVVSEEDLLKVFGVY